MNKHTFYKRTAAVVAGVVGLLLVVGVVVPNLSLALASVRIGTSLIRAVSADNGGSPAEIAVCVARSGYLRMLSSPSSSCRRGETKVTWNVEGPQGPKGDKGDTGDQGPPGPRTEVHLYDGNGQDLGLLINGDPFETYVPSLDVIFPFRNERGTGFLSTGTRGSGLGFDQSDCLGNVFTIGSTLVPRSVTMLPGPRYLKEIPDSGAERNINSYLSHGVCMNTGPQATTTTSALQDIQLPFSEPLAWPLTLQ